MSNCTAAEWEESFLSNRTRLSCLTTGQSIGLALTAESGFISLVAVLGLFMLILRKVFRKVKLIQRPTDIYMLSLFVCDLVQALGTVVNVKWVNEGKVYTGGYCTAQGVTQQLGETGVAIATLTIAIHTFIVVMWGKGKHRLDIAYCVVAINWTFVILFVSLGAALHTRNQQFYETPTPYWCWIGSGYNAERVAGEYLWLWLTLFVSILVYVPLFFWAQGLISVNPNCWYKIRVHRKGDMAAIDPDGQKRRAIGMIAYPLVYAVIVLPLSVVRWVTGFGSTKRDIPSVATFVVIFLFSLSGALNVTLFLFTRSDLLLGNGSNRRSGAGNNKNVALVVNMSRSVTTDADGSSMVSGKGGREHDSEPVRLGLVPGADEGGWELPQRHLSKESVHSFSHA